MFSICYSSTRSCYKIQEVMFSCKYSFVQISTAASFSVNVMTASDYWKGGSTSISSSVVVQGIYFCCYCYCHGTVSEQLQVHKLLQTIYGDELYYTKFLWMKWRQNHQ